MVEISTIDAQARQGVEVCDLIVEMVLTAALAPGCRASPGILLDVRRCSINQGRAGGDLS